MYLYLKYDIIRKRSKTASLSMVLVRSLSMFRNVEFEKRSCDIVECNLFFYPPHRRIVYRMPIHR